jgi:hypothetical protein
MSTALDLEPTRSATGTPWAKLLLVNLAVLTVGVAVLELAFGNWLHPNRLNRLNLLKDREIRYEVDGLYETARTYTLYRRDAYGFRGPYRSVSDIDILTLGGSTTDQRHIHEGETWQDVLRENFSAHGRTVSVVNAGIDGQSTYGYIKNFDWWFPSVEGLRARYCLVYVGINDFYKDAGAERDDLLRYGEDSVVGSIKERSALYHLFRLFKGIYAAEVQHGLSHTRVDFGSLQWTATPIAGDYDLLMKDRLDGYRKRLAILLREIHEFGAVPVLVSQRSMKYKLVGGRVVGVADVEDYDGVAINGVDYYQMLSRLNGQTRDTCQPPDCVFLDLAVELDLNEGDFYDFNHTNPAGSKKIGDYLYTKLQHLF